MIFSELTEYNVGFSATKLPFISLIFVFSCPERNSFELARLNRDCSRKRGKIVTQLIGNHAKPEGEGVNLQ